MLRQWIRYFVLICILSFEISTSAYAVPHITRGKPEPPSSIGKHFSERMKAKMFAPMQANATTGSVKVIFLKVDFPVDKDGTTTGDGTWADTEYANSGDSDYWVNKSRTDFINYYNEASFGQLVLQVDVFPSTPGTAYRLDNPLATYGTETDSALRKLIFDSATKAEAVDGATINFASYDAILIIHAGPGEETDLNGNTSNDIWSLYYSSSATIVTADGKSFSEGIFMPQTGSQDGIVVNPLGIYVHEFGHWLGLPDLYDTSGFYRWDGIGKWGLMGDGMYNEGSDGIPGSSPSHPDAWCKKYLGWVIPQDFIAPDDPGTMTLAPIETSGNSNQVLKLQASTTTSTQYFLVENRQQTGFDYGLPGNGLLVWLIDEAVINDNIGFNTVNNNPARPGVKLIEADGNNDMMMYGGDYGGPGDPFPGSTVNISLTPYTNPSSAPYTGSAWLYIKDIASSGSGINLTVGFAPVSPSGLAVSHNSTTVLTWAASAEADLAKYKVYRNGIFLAETTQNQYTDTTSSNGDTYAVTAVDINGNESEKSASVTVSFALVAAPSGLKVSHDSVTILTWIANTEPYLAKYKVYRNGIFLAETTQNQYTDTTSSNGDTYTVTAVDINGNESGMSEAVTVTFATNSSDGGGCFIATAAFGSYEAPYVKILREFRDTHLLPNIIGKFTVEFYYKVSPPIADFIRESETLRFLVRIVLLPAIAIAAFLVKTTFLQKCIFFGIVIIGAALIVSRSRRLSPVRS